MIEKVYHNFNEEVNFLRKHWWQCNVLDFLKFSIF